MKKKILVIGILVLTIFGGFFIKRYLDREFYYAGSIEVTRVDLSSRIATDIGRFVYREGDKVKKNDLLVELNCDDIVITQKFINSNFVRAKRLMKSGSMPREAFDAVANRKENIDLKLSWCQIIAPIDGTILTQYLDEREWAMPGARLIALANLKEAWAYIYIEQPLLSKVKIGMKVTGIIPELTDRLFTGNIVKINSEAEFTPKNVQTRKERSRLVFGVKIMFKNDDEILKPGMSIEVKLPEEVMN